MKSETPVSTAISSEKLGPPGVRGELHILGKTADDHRSDESQLYDRTERTFTVVGRLAKAPADTEEIKGNFGPNEGSSYLLLPQEVALGRVRCAQGMFEFNKNQAGEKSIVEFECTAHDTTEARWKFQEAVLPFLDYLSYIANVPVVVSTVRIEDRKNDRIVIEYVSPYRKVQSYPHISNLRFEMAPVYAMYREAKNSHSDFYRFLCYYKILEGLLGKLRSDVFSRARRRGVTLSRPDETVPRDTEIPKEFQSNVGQSVKAFVDKVLTPRYRNAVAHFVTNDGSILNMSAPQHIDSYASIVYVSELCVRVVVKNHDELLQQLHT
jgi:hypothetical protein